MMMTHDNMITSLSTGVIYGCNRNYSPSTRGHLRPLDYDNRPADLVRTDLLHAVGGELGESGHTSNLCSFRLRYRHCQGETK